MIFQQTPRPRRNGVKIATQGARCLKEALRAFIAQVKTFPVGWFAIPAAMPWPAYMPAFRGKPVRAAD